MGDTTVSFGHILTYENTLSLLPPSMRQLMGLVHGWNDIDESWIWSWVVVSSVCGRDDRSHNLFNVDAALSHITQFMLRLSALGLSGMR